VRQLVLECLIELPEDVHVLADTVLLTKEPWAAMLRALSEQNIAFQEKRVIMETRAKLPVATPRRVRKPKAQVQPSPQISLMPLEPDHPPEAAD